MVTLCWLSFFGLFICSLQTDFKRGSLYHTDYECAHQTSVWASHLPLLNMLCSAKLGKVRTYEITEFLLYDTYLLSPERILWKIKVMITTRSNLLKQLVFTGAPSRSTCVRCGYTQEQEWVNFMCSLSLWKTVCKTSSSQASGQVHGSPLNTSSSLSLTMQLFTPKNSVLGPLRICQDSTFPARRFLLEGIFQFRRNCCIKSLTEQGHLFSTPLFFTCQPLGTPPLFISCWDWLWNLQNLTLTWSVKEIVLDVRV